MELDLSKIRGEDECYVQTPPNLEDPSAVYDD